MKKLVSSFIALFLICASASAQQTEFTQLFDGRTLANWTVDNPKYADNFSVRNGMLRIEGEGGWLRSARQYEDYTLRFEFRYLADDPGGRTGISGVFLNVPPATETYGNGWPKGVEVQLSNRGRGNRTAAPGDPRWGGNIVYRDVMGGPTYFDTEMALRSYPDTGEWQTHEIQVVGDFVTVLLNDRLLGSGYLGGGADSGHIGLQAESGAIEFRSIEIIEGVRPIPPRNWDGFVSLFNGENFDGWERANPDGEMKYSIPEEGVMRVIGRRSIGLRGSAPSPDLGFPEQSRCSGHLLTEREYSDFTLRFEARFDDGLADSGFLTRMPADGGAYQISLQGMGSTELPWNGLMFRQSAVPQGMTMMDYGLAEKAYKTHSPVQQWTTYEVQAFGPTMVIKMNGLVVGRAENIYPSGKLGFQCEVNTVDLRNVYIREGIE